MENGQVKVIAHRGNSAQFPENTSVAFREAIQLHVDFIECDVQLTRDGVPVVIHDSTFKRITKNSVVHPVDSYAIEEIKHIDIGSWFDRKFSEERVLTLEDLLCIPKNHVGVMVEVKKETFFKCEFGKHIAEVLKRVEPKVPVIVGSQSPTVLYCVEAYLPEQRFIPIVRRKAQLKEFQSLRAKHYALHYSIATRRLIEKLKEEEKEVWVWTVDDKDTAKKLVDRGVTGIITNHPKKMMALRT